MVIIASVETAVRSVVQRCNRPSPAQSSGARCLLVFSRSTVRPTLGTLENLHYTTYSTLHYVCILGIFSCTASRKTKESVHLNNVATTTSIQN